MEVIKLEWMKPKKEQSFQEGGFLRVHLRKDLGQEQKLWSLPDDKKN